MESSRGGGQLKLVLWVLSDFLLMALISAGEGSVGLRFCLKKLDWRKIFIWLEAESSLAIAQFRSTRR
jgi:hypothetical protein